MKKTLAALLTAALLTCLCTAFATDPSASDWAQDSLDQAIALGFVPEDLQSAYQQDITRGEFAAIAMQFLAAQYGYDVEDFYFALTWRAAQDPDAPQLESPFVDGVSKHVDWAYSLGVVNGQVEEVYSGHNVVKAFNREAVVLNDFNAANDKLYESAWKSQFLSGLMMPIMNFVGNLGYVAVAIVGSIFAANGTITIGDIQAFIQYVKNFTQPIQQLSQVSNMLQSMAAAAERVFEFLNEPEEDQQADPARRADPGCINGQVTFSHVRFGYTPDKTVIHDFSCEVKPGQKVAIVGPTGAGKTTMVKLLMRFYDVDSGSITLNGHDVRDFDRSALREGFGMVLQDTWLFKGTIMENIRYGRLDATDEEVIAAAKAANADHFIRTLPGGYQMELNEDASNVSQGQKQLLTIARTILADNRILILDEATSSVDTRTEQRIQTAMDRLMEGRTSFVIAHRLSTIKDADLILVMRDGDIVEQGTHDQLIEAGGFYADLYNSQFEDVVD